MTIDSVQLTQSAISTTSYGDVEIDSVSSQKELKELSNEALPRETVEQYMLEIRDQPAWRRESDRCVEFYDNNQLDAETLQTLEERGQPPLIDNYIKPAIDTMLGIEAKSRTDYIVRSEDDNIANSDLSEALSLKLKLAETESRADRACSDAYAAMLKAGLGFVEVARESDAMKYKHRVKYIHRREIFWDWRSEQSDFSDARYLIRRRWSDLDAAIAMMPQYASLFRNTLGGWSAFDSVLAGDTNLFQSKELERDTNLDSSDWRDSAGHRVCLSEIWYRKWVRDYVMVLPNGRTVEVDFNNPRHNEAIVSGVVTIKMATFQKVRLAWYCGPHFLYDVPSPYSHNHFPYVPFFGYREDLTLAPYGAIRTMLSPQIEVNARKSKMLWSLNSRRVVTDSDAVADHVRTAQEVARSDAYIILNDKRKPGSTFKVESGGELAAQQFQAMQEAKASIADVSGIHKTMMGQQTGASSGLAINSLAEQSSNTTAEINDNFRFARRLVGELLFSLEQEDLSGKPINVQIGKGKSKKIITLNMPVQNPETGEITIENDVSKVRTKVVLDEIPSTPTFRLQQLQMLTEVTKSLPPQAQSLIIDFVIEATDMAGAEKIADRLRKGMNLPDESPEAEQAQAQMQQQQQAIQQQQLALEMSEREAKIEQIKALTQKTISELGNGNSDAANAVRAESAKIVTALEQQLQDLQQQLFNKDLESKANDDALTLKAHTDIEQSNIKAESDIAKEREITAREIQRAEIEARATIETARINATNANELDVMRAELDRLNSELTKAIQGVAQVASPI